MTALWDTYIIPIKQQQQQQQNTSWSESVEGRMLKKTNTVL